MKEILFYLLVFILQIVLLRGYFKIANRFNIIDSPNERSSHSYVTFRGGGIIFPVTAFLWFLLFGYSEYWIISALMLMAIVSFWDDVVTLTSKIRFLVHLIAVTILFWQLEILGLPWYLIVLAYLITLGWINAFNFMDGINGITALYGLVALGTFAWLNQSFGFVSQQLIIALIISVLVFTFYNARRKARTFAGDIGSVSLAFILAWLMISLILKTGRIEYILLFAVYGVDSVLTILYRIMNRENIFKAHRSHLYQYLSNEFKWPHVLVSAIYSFLQLAINVITIRLIFIGEMSWPVLAALLALLCATYIVSKFSIYRSLNLKLC